MPKLLSRTKYFKVRCNFITGYDYIHVRIDESGTIGLREPRARRWLEFPIARIYTLACMASVPHQNPRSIRPRNRPVAAQERRSPPDAAPTPDTFPREIIWGSPVDFMTVSRDIVEELIRNH